MKVCIESILHDIKHISEEASQKCVNRRQFHNTMQQKIVNLANSFNIKGLKEYRVRDGLIDVAWLSDLNPIAVFEIDSSLRIKSIRKLLAVEVPSRFWVYYKYDPNNLIGVIQLQHIRFKRERSGN